MSKYFLYIILFLHLSNCGFNGKNTEAKINTKILFEKSKEFYQQLANLENASQKITTEALKRLRVDFGE